jgi:hypothetical protein
MNESDRAYGASNNSQNLDELNEVINRLGMTRVRCADATGDQTTNTGTTGECKGAPDWIVIDRTRAHNIRTEIVHTNRISAHSHEPIHVWIYVDPRNEIRGVPWAPVRETDQSGGTRQRAKQWRDRNESRPRRWKTPTDEEKACMDAAVGREHGGWRTTLAENLDEARKDMYTIINKALDTRGERPSLTKRRDMKSGGTGGSKETLIRHNGIYDMAPGDRWDSIWRNIASGPAAGGDNGNPRTTRTDREEYQNECISRTETEAQRVRRTRHRITTAMKGRIRLEPKFVWDAIRRINRAPLVRAPTAIWTKDAGGNTDLIHRPEEVQKVWEKVFTRNSRPQDGTEWDEEFKARTNRALTDYLTKLDKARTPDAIRGEVKEWDWPVLMRKAHRVLKDVGTGPMNVTGKMIKEAGSGILGMVDEFVEEVVTRAEIPSAMSMDEVVPVFKYNNPAVPTNFRPVSLSDEDMKMTLAIMREKMLEWINGPMGPGMHPNSFGSKKGRDRTIALWCIKATVRHEQIVSNGAATVALVVADAKSAFPTLWREHLAMKLLSWGMPIAIWRRWWATVSNLHGYIKIADLVTRVTLYFMGVNQGSILAADEWSWYIQDIPDQISGVKEARAEFAMTGTGLAGDSEGKATRPVIPFISYVDDTVSVLHAPRRGGRVGQHTMNEADKYATKNRINWAKQKTKMLVIRSVKDRKADGCEQDAPKWHTKLAGVTTEAVSTIKILGEHIDETLYRSKKQFEAIVTAARLAGENIKWTCADEKGALTDLMRTLLTTLVMSKIRVGLAMSDITDKQAGHIDALMARIVKDTAGLSRRTPARVALAWFGLRTARTELQHETLRIYGRIRTEAAGRLAHETYERRMKQLREGKETQGLLADVQRIIGDDRELLEFWNNDQPWTEKKLNRWKKAIAAATLRRERTSWLAWVNDKKNGGPHNNRLGWSMPSWPEHCPWKAIGHLNRKQQARYIAFVTGALALRGNRDKDGAHGGASDTSCRLCGRGAETEWHMMNTCVGMEAARDKMWNATGLPSKVDSPNESNDRFTALLSPCRRHNDTRTQKKRVNALSRFLSELAARMAVQGVELVPTTWKDDEQNRMNEDESAMNANAQGFTAMRVSVEGCVT